MIERQKGHRHLPAVEFGFGAGWIVEPKQALRKVVVGVSKSRAQASSLAITRRSFLKFPRAKKSDAAIEVYVCVIGLEWHKFLARGNRSIELKAHRLDSSLSPPQ